MLDETTPFAGATISGFDLGSNQPLTIRTTADLASGAANPSPPVTDAEGNFDLVVRDPAPEKALRLVVAKDGKRLVAVTERWRMNGPAAGYRLSQLSKNVAVNASVRAVYTDTEQTAYALTAMGAFKLQLQRADWNACDAAMGRLRATSQDGWVALAKHDYSGGAEAL
jgi:hypothetical protein